MTFNNFNSLQIGTYKLKKLVRVSDGLILFEKKSEPSYKGLCFTAEEDSSIYLVQGGEPDALTLQTSYDGTTWSDFGRYDIITLTQGQKIYFRNKNTVTRISKSASVYWRFGMTGKIAASGNVYSLLSPDFTNISTFDSYAFSHLFDGCSALTTAPELPVTKLGQSCYYTMFQGCTALTQAPKLPATTLANACYTNMFKGCTALTQAPELPATTLATACYSNMFNSCTALTQAPKLPATELGQQCYRTMFQGCTALTQAPELPATALKILCYNTMFQGCTALTSAPKIAATSYATSCMMNMFRDCSRLAYIDVDMTTWPSASYINGWVTGVANNGIFKCPASLTEEHSTNRIPNGWTVERK